MSNIKVYKDNNANAIFIEDANGVQFINSLQASVPTTTVTITDLAKNIEIVSNQNHGDFVNENGVTYEQISIDNGGSGTATEVCNLLNAIFQSSGTPLTNVPEITSTLTATIVQGQTLNYELTANYGVGYEWDLSNVSGVTTVEGNVRKLIGGSNLSVGTYNIPVKAINYNGEDSETLVLTVSTPPFSNTKSINFNNNDFLGANAALMDGILGRSGNGSGSSDAWSISVWFKPGTANNAAQTILYFGAQDVANGGYIQLKYNGATGGQRLELRYGSNNNRVTFFTAVGSINTNNWYHFLVTYDGGTTGSSSGDINNYYSRFKIYINGSLQTLINQNSNFGYSSAISGENFRVGRWNSGQNLRNNCRVDELAIWGSDQSSNIADIYNSGSVLDLSTLTTPPEHWWRMGDGDTYPNLQDRGDTGGCTFVMNNMTSADIVSDVP